MKKMFFKISKKIFQQAFLLMTLIKRVVKGVKFDQIGIFGSFPYKSLT